MTGSQGGIAAAMARQLEERGADAVALVDPGEGTEWAERSPACAPPGAARRTASSTCGAPAARPAEADGGFLGLLGLARSSPASRPPRARVQLRVVTTGLQAVGRGEDRELAASGPRCSEWCARSPWSTPGSAAPPIDVEPPAGGEDLDRLAALLIAETAAPAAESRWSPYAATSAGWSASSRSPSERARTSAACRCASAGST